jgi:hypothetical protein
LEQTPWAYPVWTDTILNPRSDLPFCKNHVGRRDEHEVDKNASLNEYDDEIGS